MEEDISVIGASYELDLGEVSPRDQEHERDDDADEESEVDVEQDGRDEGGHPDEGLGERPPGVAEEVLVLLQDADQGHKDDGGENSLETI